MAINSMHIRIQSIRLRSMARRAGSECDPVLRLLDSKGAVVTEVDDSPGMGKDARIEWKAPSDGIYTVQIADLHARGGEALPYVILAEAGQSRFLRHLRPRHDQRRPGRASAALRPGGSATGVFRGSAARAPESCRRASRQARSSSRPR